MATIAGLLRDARAFFDDKGLLWGARASLYRPEIEVAIGSGRQPVLVELSVDIDLPRELVVVIDHHGSRAGAQEPTSLHQVFDLLRLPAQKWTRHFTLVAANDRGHIEELVAVGATQAEIEAIRAADRRAQGVSAAEEESGALAAKGARWLAGGRLAVVELGHSRSSTVADRLHAGLGGPGYRSLLVLCPAETNFFGPGWIIERIDRAIPGGWKGGALPDKGFWGCGTREADLATQIERWWCRHDGS